MNDEKTITINLKRELLIHAGLSTLPQSSAAEYQNNSIIDVIDIRLMSSEV